MTRAFQKGEARARAAACVREIESATSAEVVLVFRPRSATYRSVDYLAGFLLSLVTLTTMLFVSQPFQLISFPIDAALSFVVGALVASRLPALHRVTGRRRQARRVREAALAAFVELGVGRLAGRWGLLVFVSLLERRLEVVPDIGIDLARLGDEWSATVRRLEAAVARADFEGFLTELGALGPMLGRVLPRREDDVNELPDEVRE